MSKHSEHRNGEHSESPENSTKNTPSEPSAPELSYTPASPLKRTMAWIGLFYMLVLMGLSFYGWFFGSFLNNLAPLLALPALFGGGILSLVGWKSVGNPPKSIAIAITLLFWGIGIATIPLAIEGLLSNF